MLYAIIATDVENSLENRLATRPAHLAARERAGVGEPEVAGRVAEAVVPFAEGGRDRKSVV